MLFWKTLAQAIFPLTRWLALTILDSGSMKLSSQESQGRSERLEKKVQCGGYCPLSIWDLSVCGWKPDPTRTASTYHSLLGRLLPASRNTVYFLWMDKWTTPQAHPDFAGHNRAFYIFFCNIYLMNFFQHHVIHKTSLKPSFWQDWSNYFKAILAIILFSISLFWMTFFFF